MCNKIYPSDLSDGEFDYLKKCLPPQPQRGRRRKHQWRAICNAILYLLRTGCAWRYLPHDYPPWKTVYHYFRQWRLSGRWKRINKRLRRMLRKKVGRHPQSSAAVLDSQSVKSSDCAREATGFDMGRRVNGRKRHILVDTLGLLIGVVVHAASVSETAGAKLVLEELARRWWRLRLIWLDGGYKESLWEWVKTIRRWRRVRLEQVKRSDAGKGFRVVAKRWVVERTFGWLMKQRRLTRDYEGLCETLEAMVYGAMIRLMLARLAA